MTTQSGAQFLPPEIVARPAIAALVQSIEARDGAHALLLVGPAGAGPRAAAKYIARRAVCASGGCGVCGACTRIRVREDGERLHVVHPDVAWIEPEGQAIRAVHVDQLLEIAMRMPFEAERQVAVLERAHTLDAANATAANRLLKVLEEPPGPTRFVLLADQAGPVLPTIRSRVLEIRFDRATDAEIAHYLALVQASGGISHDIAARAARGDLERAYELATGGPAMHRRAQVVAEIIAVLNGSADPSAVAHTFASHVADVGQAETDAATAEYDAVRERMAPEDAKRLERDTEPEGHPKQIARRARRAQAEEVASIVAEACSVLRDVVLVAAGTSAPLENPDFAQQAAAFATTHVGAHAIVAIDALQEVATRQRVNVNIDLAFASALTELAGVANGRVRSRRSIVAMS